MTEEEREAKGHVVLPVVALLLWTPPQQMASTRWWGCHRKPAQTKTQYNFIKWKELLLDETPPPPHPPKKETILHKCSIN